MAGWNYRLEAEGKLLREYVDGEETFKNSANCLKQIRVCCKSIMNSLRGRDKDYYYDDFEELYELIDGEPEMLLDNPAELFELGFTGATELVNDRLAQFYDLCDVARVWIGL